MKAKKDIKHYKDDFSKWNEYIKNYSQAFYSESIDLEKATVDATKVLNEILMYYISSCKVRDKFSELKIGIPIARGFFLETKSLKMDITFDFGIIDDNFYLESFIEYPFYMKSMDDDFWHQLSKLNNLGNFSFLENACPDSNKFKDILKNVKCKKSNIFKIILNYILLESSGGSGDFGSLEIKWPIETSWDILFNNGLEAFKIMYKLNYQLYRAYSVSKLKS